jgi:hypothetical protein
MKRQRVSKVALLAALAASFATPAFAQDGAEKSDAAELAKKLQNPATRHTVHIQPVIPFPVTEEWNLITFLFPK